MTYAVKFYHILFSNRKIIMIFRVALGVVFCVLLQNSSEVIRQFYSMDVEFKTTKNPDGFNGLRKTADISSLPIGAYFISAGKPRSLCELKIDDKVVDSTVSPVTGFRSRLLLGSAFETTADNKKNKVEIICLNDGGFIPGMSEKPTVLPFKAGTYLHFFRSLTGVLIGPFISILFLLTVGLSLFRGGAHIAQHSCFLRFLHCFIHFHYLMSPGCLFQVFMPQHFTGC